MNQIVRNKSEIYQLLVDCNDITMQGLSKFPSMTYEEGISAALQWIFGETNEHPLEE